jgi:hypothetical protein
MAAWAPITYRGFWDVPRVFLARHNGQVFLFDCAFSEELDDYPDDYSVYLLPPDLHEENLPADWTRLRGLAVRRLGTIPVDRVAFDPTKRKQIDASVLDGLVAAPSRTPG